MTKVEISDEDKYAAHMFWPPSPVVLISSIDRQGLPNVAPFSLNQFYSYISSYPQVIVVGIGGHTGKISLGKKQKRTYLNIAEVKDFVVNIPSEGDVDKVSALSVEKGPSFNKFDASGMTSIPSLKVKSPSVRECKAHFECQLIKIDDYGGQTDLIFGRIVALTADEEISKLRLDERLQRMKPLYYYGSGPGKGLYYSVGRVVGERDDSRNT
jgi:flavin reductase (DIM6/NTAB) family NADH-FMN oxidoreductase RutF|tara:strand:+ start:301 stop:936 length:636 start_codon:yes stop_codon:yes gene_type:complete